MWMTLNTSECNHLRPLHFKGLKLRHIRTNWPYWRKTHIKPKCEPKQTGSSLTPRTAHTTVLNDCDKYVHNTAQNSSNILPSSPADNHHCSDVVYWREARAGVY